MNCFAVRNYRYRNKCFPLISGVQHLLSGVKSTEVWINRRKTYTSNDYIYIFIGNSVHIICERMNWYRWQGPPNEFYCHVLHIAIEIAFDSSVLCTLEHFRSKPNWIECASQPNIYPIRAHIKWIAHWRQKEIHLIWKHIHIRNGSMLTTFRWKRMFGLFFRKMPSCAHF